MRISKRTRERGRHPMLSSIMGPSLRHRVRQQARRPRNHDAALRNLRGTNRWKFDANRSQRELLADFCDDFFRGSSHVDGDGVTWLFQVGELAREELFRGVVSLAQMQSLEKEFVGAFQINEFCAGTNLQAFAVAFS